MTGSAEAPALVPGHEFQPRGLLEGTPGFVHRSKSARPTLGQNLADSAPDGVSLVIPAYNEEARLGRALDAYLPVLETMGRPFEVIVVMDGTDGTPHIVEEYAGRRVVGVSSHVKLGKGGALLKGFSGARFGVIGYVDADGSLGAQDLARMIQQTSASDCVVASRWLPGSQWVTPEPLVKRILSRGFNFLVRGLLGLPLSDTQCGAKFFRASLLRGILPEVTVTNLTVDVGVLFHARRAGASIREMPVTWDDDRRTRFNLGKMVMFMLITVVGIRLMNLRSSGVVPARLVAFFSRWIGNV